MRGCLLFISFSCCVNAARGQEGTFLALDNNGQIFMVHTDPTQGCKSSRLNLCSNMGSPLSIGLSGNTLYINDNQGNLYSTTLDANGSVGDCKLIGSFLSRSGAIYGLTVGPDSIVYAGSSNLIETYNIKTGTFGTLGRLPSNYSIGGDLMFYNGSLFEACSNRTTGQNDLVLVNMANPSLSTQYLQFTTGTKIFGFASVTNPCSYNQSFALGQSGDIYKVDMASKTQDLIPSCSLGFRINDAASLAETQTEAPPPPPVVISPTIFCVNTPSTPLTAKISDAKDTLRWYTTASGGNATAAPTPIIGSSPSTITYYVSQYNTTTTCEGDRSVIVVNINSIITPSITISTSKNGVCTGKTVDFKAISNIGTTNPTYQWEINGQNVGNNKDTFSTSSVVNNDKVICVMDTKLSCATSPSTSSNEIIIASTVPSYPAISIKASEDTFCPGTLVTFVATKTIAGTSQTQQWMVNGAYINNSSDTFITSSLRDGNIVSCNLFTSGKCVFPDTATSNAIKVSSTALFFPTLTISADKTAACAGAPISFSSTQTHGGLKPAYQWKVNRINIDGATSSTFNSTTLNDQDVVTCQLIADTLCLISNSAISNDIKVTITPNPVPSIFIAASDTLICKGDNVSFNASVKNAGTSPTFQWLINGKDIGVNTSAFSSNTLSNNDTVTSRFIVNTACAGLDTAKSNPVVIKDASLLKPTIVISADTTTICSGAKVKFKSAINNGGKQPVYIWKKNGVSIIGATSDTLKVDSLADGDVISATLTSSIPCLPVNTAISLPIKIKVNSLPILPAIVGADSICVNKTTMLTNAILDGTWSTNQSSIASINASGTVTGISAGNAVVSYSKTNTCGSTTQLHPMTVSSNELGEIVGVSSICKGDDAQFSNSAAITGTWKSTNTAVATVSVNGLVNAIDTGFTTITYDIVNACGTNTLSKAVKVSGEAQLAHPYSFENPTCIKPFSGKISINALGAETPYKILLNSDTLAAPTTLTKLGEGYYPAYIYNNNGCLVDSIMDIILKMPEDGICNTLHVPTGFVPGSTAGNNLLRPIGGNVNNIKDITFRVFNRFGNKVFESHSLYNGWDGRVNGVLQDAGTYIWFLEYTPMSGVLPLSFKGTSVLLR